MFDRPNLNIVFLGFNDPRRFIRGVENVISRLAESTSGRCFYVYRGGKTEVHRWGKVVSISIPSNYVTGFFVLNNIIRKIKSNRVILVHGNSYYLSLMYCGRNLVFTVYDGLTYLKSMGGSRIPWVFSLIEFIIYQRSKKIHSISSYTWNQARFSKIFEEKVSVMYCSDAHEPSEQSMDISVASANTQSYFLAVRSIEERANIGLLLDLAETLRQSASQGKIVVAGKGPLLDYYRAEAARRELSNIEFRGYVSDDELDRLYRGAKCVLVPALFGEGFGLPIIEAYARGIPVAAADICAIPEVILAPGHLFANDVASVIRAIDAACSVPRAAYVGYYRKRFAANLIKRQYAEFYTELTMDSTLSSSPAR